MARIAGGGGAGGTYAEQTFKISDLSTPVAYNIGGAGSGRSRLLSTTIRDEVKTYIDLVRTVTAQVALFLPSMPPANGLDLVVKVDPAAIRYSFDWIDGGFKAVTMCFAARGQAEDG